MNWYRKAEEADILDEVVKECVESHRYKSAAPVPPTEGVRRWFSPRTSWAIAVIDFVTMLDPLKGLVSDFSIQSAILTVDKDMVSVAQEMSRLGYHTRQSPVSVSNAWGKKKVSSSLFLSPPEGGSQEEWSDRFWNGDQVITGARTKVGRSWQDNK